MKSRRFVFSFFPFEERIRKAPLLRWISVDGRPKRGNKAAFLSFTGVVWTLYGTILIAYITDEPVSFRSTPSRLYW